MANSFLSFSLASIFVVILLISVFFKKKRVRSITNKIYVFIMFLVLFCIASELIAYWAVPFYFPDNLSIQIIASKINLLSISFWVACTCFYITIIALDDKTRKNINIRFYLFLGIFIISVILILLTPIKFMFDEEKIGLLYSYGLSPKMVLYLSITYVLVAFFHVVVRKDSSDNAPIVVIVLLLFFGIIIGIIELYYPFILVISLMQTIVLFVLYVTVQNPDLNMIIDLNFAREQVEKASASKTNFLASMNHEIKTPLNAIVGLSEDIMLNPDVPESAREDVNDIAISSKILMDIIGNIIDINKIEDGTMNVVESPYSIKNEINNIIQSLNVSILNNKNQIQIEISKEVPKVLYGDVNHINKILMNLISNAVKFTKNGSIKIVVRSENNLENMTTLLKVFVVDSGKGIEEENLTKLFNRFEKIDNNAYIEGTGLGLAITKKLLELMGGEIEVESTYGIGSTFSFTLPQKIGCAFNEVINEIPDDVTDLSKLRVLVVDDNLLNIKVAKRIFNTIGIKISYCLSGFECVERIVRGELYDLIFMDVLMPDMPGDIVIKKIKERVELETPIIALTASVDIGYDRKLRNMGFTDYLSKPFTKEQLRKKINIILSEGKKGV